MTLIALCRSDIIPTMTAASFSKIQEKLPELTERQRLTMAAALHRLKQNTPAWQREMTRRMAEMGKGKKFSLSKLMPKSANA